MLHQTSLLIKKIKVKVFNEIGTNRTVDEKLCLEKI